MNIRIISVGKIKEAYMRNGIDEFKKRLSRYCKLELVEVKDERAPEGLSDREKESVKEVEAARVFKHIRQSDYVICLAIEGEILTSEEFAKKLDTLAINGCSNVSFIIGGSLGLHDTVLKRADMLLSFSAFTFPHQLMRLILLEQIYRGYRIINGEPYHK